MHGTCAVMASVRRFTEDRNRRLCVWQLLVKGAKIVVHLGTRSGTTRLIP